MLAKQGRQRRIGLWVPHFTSAPLAVVASDMVSTLVSRVARRARELFGVRVFEPPLELPTLPVKMSWSRAHDEDAARSYLRELVRRWNERPGSLATGRKRRS